MVLHFHYHGPLPLTMWHCSNKRYALNYSLYATKVGCTAGNKKATLFLGRIGSGASATNQKGGQPL